MQHIVPLPQSVIAKIAAGEVVERPVFAVKELIENALDAGATAINVEIEKSGVQKIRVTDNGEGMSKEDVGECFKSHTTSKIASEDDLYSVRSLGFRGEALSSIAAISALTIQSRVHGNAGGYSVELHNGVIFSTGPVGMPEGTVITVANLFANIPARKKFLKSNKTEFGHIIDLTTQYALHYPHVQFRLLHNKKLIFDLPVTDKAKRVQAIVGKTIFEQCIPIAFEDVGITIEGFIAKPQVNSYSKNKQFTYINGRSVSDKIVGQAIKDAYGSLLPQAAYPIFILSLQMPYEMVDVNVHPRKETVQFVNTKMVYDVVALATRTTLAQHNITFTHSLNKNIYERSTTKEQLKEEVLPWSVKNIGEIVDMFEPFVLHNTYILLETKRGMLLVDFHAAHERILYEQYQEVFLQEKEKKKTTLLEEKVLLKLSLTDQQLFIDNSAMLTALGFSFSVSKGKLEITRIPTLLEGRNIETCCRELLEQFQDAYGENDIDKKSNQTIAYLACRSAIKAGDRLTKSECINLIEKLKKTKLQYTCPHGRPTQIEIPLQDLHKMFKRL